MLLLNQDPCAWRRCGFVALGITHRATGCIMTLQYKIHAAPDWLLIRPARCSTHRAGIVPPWLGVRSTVAVCTAQ